MGKIVPGFFSPGRGAFATGVGDGGRCGKLA